MSGRVIAVVGPSGAGKDTLLAGVAAARPDLHRARRSITRAATQTEDFEPLTEAEFARAAAAGEFALHWRAHGLGYGLRHAEFAAGDVVFNGSRAALAQARAVFPELFVVEIAVSAPVLAARLAARGRETTDEIADRLARRDLACTADVIISNDADPESAIRAMLGALYPLSGY